jgi:hypothetical protein
MKFQVVLFKVNLDPGLVDESSSDEKINESDLSSDHSVSHTETEKSQESPNYCNKEQ